MILVADAIVVCYCSDIVTSDIEYIHAFAFFYKYSMQFLQRYLNF